MLKPNGILTYITSNKWMKAAYGKNLRNLFVKKTNPMLLIDFAGQKIFDNATVDVNIIMFSKQKNNGKTTTCLAETGCLNNLSDFVNRNNNKVSFQNDDAWKILNPIEQSIQNKIDTYGTKLIEWDVSIYRGILTGYNEAFIIDGKTKDCLIKSDSKSAELIRPILRGRDIKRYHYDFMDLWLINTHNGVKDMGIPPVSVDDYPAIKNHLDNYYDKLKKRADQGITPYNLRNCIYMDEFSKQKIVWKRIGSLLKFAYDDSGSVTLDSTCIATGKNIKYLAAILNTTLGNYLFINSPKTGTGDLIISVQAFEPIKIPQISENEMQKFEELYDCIKLCIDKGEDYSKYELELENKTYQLYDINDIERKYIEKTSRNLFR